MESKSISSLTNDQETIIALCTPRGSGAIAVLRLSGIDAIDVAQKIAKLSCNKKLSEMQTHTINHGHVVFVADPGKKIDEVLFLLMKAPKTFTGQDTVEINCHNNPFIIEQIIEQVILAGARLAERGEFTKRSFLNGKIDLVQAESINDLIHAQTELALKKSMSQLQGTLSNYVAEIELDLIGLLSIVEGSFEFFEEEQQDLDIPAMIKQRMDLILSNLKNAKANFSQQQQIKDGIKICLLGWVNAGKSTLFNALLKKDRAIVTKIEGTTRDSIECSLYKNGNFWLLVDTAGLRQTEDFIEQEGIEKSWEYAAQADIILLTVDLSSQLSEKQIEIYRDIFDKYHDKIIFVATKVDIENENTLKSLDFACNQKILKVSALQRKGIDLLENCIENKIQELFCKLQSPFLLNQRQHSLITQLEQKMEFVVNQYSNSIECELIAYQIKEMLGMLAQITGKNITEKMLDRVFKDFCVGK